MIEKINKVILIVIDFEKVILKEKIQNEKFRNIQRANKVVWLCKVLSFRAFGKERTFYMLK